MVERVDRLENGATGYGWRLGGCDGQTDLCRVYVRTVPRYSWPLSRSFFTSRICWNEGRSCCRRLSGQPSLHCVYNCITCSKNSFLRGLFS